MSQELAPPVKSAKQAVLEHWEQASCGEELYLRSPTAEGYREQARSRCREATAAITRTP